MPSSSATLRTGRPRVMQVVLSLDPGGTERLVIEITKALQSSIESVVCCLDHPGAWASELTERGVPVVSLGRRPGFRPGLGYQIAHVASWHAVDVLHCHHYSPFVYGQIGALVRRGLRVVFTEHGRLSDGLPSFKRRVVNPLLGRLPAAIFAVSADLRRHMIEEGLPKSRVKIIHNGIDPRSRPTAADRRRARQSLGLGSDHLVVGTVGRLDPVKDQATMLDTFAALHRTHPDVRLIVVGDGPERHRLEQQAATLGVGDVILFTGYRDDVRSLLPAFDVYANSSIHEGVSLTILEAMAAAIPVVASRVGGTPEVVIDGESGLVVPARSPSSLATAIDSLVRAPELRCRLGDAARVRVERHFSVGAMTTSYLKAYRAALEH